MPGLQGIPSGRCIKRGGLHAEQLRQGKASVNGTLAEGLLGDPPRVWDLIYRVGMSHEVALATTPLMISHSLNSYPVRVSSDRISMEKISKFDPCGSRNQEPNGACIRRAAYGFLGFLPDPVPLNRLSDLQNICCYLQYLGKSLDRQIA
jgi:hypothetical protein